MLSTSNAMLQMITDNTATLIRSTAAFN